MKKKINLLIPAMLDFHFPLLKYAFCSGNYNAVILDYSENIAEIGLRYSHNDLCYPVILIIGQMITALKSGKYDMTETAFMIPQADVYKRQYRTQRIFPGMYDIFNAFKYTSYDNVKAVIIGQDPYHGVGQAHGLCFSVKKGVAPPPSLVNIFKEIKEDVGIDNKMCIRDSCNTVV